MAYFTGTANNPVELLAWLKSKAEESGWTTDKFAGGEWFFHNNDGFWSLKAYTDKILLCGNTGFNAANTWDNQPGSARLSYVGSEQVTRLQLASNPLVACHLFATTGYLHLVVEINSGHFRHAHIGTLNKFGDYEGGQYASGTIVFSVYRELSRQETTLPFDSYAYYINEASCVRVAGHDAQSNSNNTDWLRFSYHYSNSKKAIGLGRGYLTNGQHPAHQLVQTSANALTGGTLLIPCTIYTQGAANRTRLIGEVKDFRICRMDYLAAGDTVTVGSEQWRVFPAYERTQSDNAGSGMVGYAYRVVD